jgi:hypothetical protein
MAAPILPTASSIVTPAIDAIVARRPTALARFNEPGSHYNDLPAIWRAQILTNLARVADECKSARLRFSKGDALRALCASEFNTSLPPEPQTAVATIVLQRPAPGAGHAPPGVIAKGTRFVKNAQPSGLPAVYPLPIAAATYEVRQTVYVAKDQLQASVVADAQRSGVDANIPLFSGYPPPTLIAPAQPLFDPTFATSVCVAGGGSSGLDDATLIAASKAYAIGQFGPTDGAIVAGVLRDQSVRHYAAFRANGSVPYAQLFIADESWSWADVWAARVQQAFADTWQGFGCRVSFAAVANTQVAVTATIVLASTDALSDTSDIDTNVRAAVRAYFDGRPDWYSFRLASIQATIGACDPRILHCSSVSVTDPTTGLAIPEPAGGFALSVQTSIIHWYMTDNTMTATYAPPS